MIIGCVLEHLPGERRVALVPQGVAVLKKAGLDVLIEQGVGEPAGYRDAGYVDKGAHVTSRGEVLSRADLLVGIRFQPDLLPTGSRHPILVGILNPYDQAASWARYGGTAFSLELMPRITRAQGMDVLSSQANISGYRAVLLAAERLPRLLPMMMTPSGTISAARVLIVGAGVAGLQAIATARRLGAVVSGYDVRPAVREQVESLGAKFLELNIDSQSAEDKGGYAKELGEEFYKKQREMMLKAVAGSDIVITTAAIPGKRSPVLITAEMVRAMAPGSVVVDLAAERGGNCELTKPDEEVREGGVLVLGPTNLPSTAAYHSSQILADGLIVTHIMLHFCSG